MTLQGYDMTVLRGETFTIDKSVRNRDGSPYIVSNQYIKPYVLLSVASSKYEQEGRYLLNFWIDLKNLPRFENTVPKEITEFEDAYVADDFEGQYLYYKNGDIANCKYWIWDDKASKRVWKDYDFRIIHTFTHAVTKEWVEQTYIYSLRLVSGMDMYLYLNYLYESVFNEPPRANITSEELYLAIKNKDEKFVKDVIISRPIATFDTIQDLMPVSKITVLADLNGGL